MTDETITVRPFADSDLPAARGLLDQLGYDLSHEETARRVAIVGDTAGHALFVAETTAAGVVGLMHLFERPAVEKPPEVVIQSLVVDDEVRGIGVGRELMAHAEAWAAARGHGSISLYSNLVRQDARAFYARLGFKDVAHSALLRKTLG